MPKQIRYPGVYVEEVPSGLRPIAGVPTSITSFIGSAVKGPEDTPTRVLNFTEYEHIFGGLSNTSTMSFALHDFFQNGGQEAIIVRVTNNAKTSSGAIADQISIRATSSGAWGNGISIWIDHATKTPKNKTLFNLHVQHTNGEKEVFLDLSSVATNARYAKKVVNKNSNLIEITGLKKRPDILPESATFPLQNGTDGAVITKSQLIGLGNQTNKKGLYALDKADGFNILCLPPYSRTSDIEADTFAEATHYCNERRAILIMNPPPDWDSSAKAITGVTDFSRNKNAAMYFPRLLKLNSLNDQIEEFVPCGAIAGIIARTDMESGVWKAPAGIEAGISGINALSIALTDSDNSRLNELGINCLRSFPGQGRCVWGARTLDGANSMASEWKYLQVRRTALYIEESISKGLNWTVFEPNDESLWSQIRLAVNGFMNDLFRSGAFQGQKPSEAYFVKCDSETTTQHDINLHSVNVLIGFAPLKPAEFIIIEIKKVAGKT